ncbi:hypothetical protein THAOC_15116 [Thalassiosira oceanica]|uniref:J domain-containing protein n=2 Tax=Thalassiosira oceanica TaxID=159749 RepID=K0SGS4_THAOC|nr:hypothetical protein THAOC_15116 [Thalassiosira oceanica]|eukprot:EJK64174.1 hypothetical protein THAOC_15116 [Thalassiosira oceanica]
MKLGPTCALLLGCTLKRQSVAAFRNLWAVRAPHRRCSLATTHIVHGALFAQSADAAQSTGESSQASAALQTIGDWECYLDESKGLVYYHNRITGKSQWEQPEDVAFDNVHRSIPLSKKVEMRNRLKAYLEERLTDSSTDFIGTLQDDRKDAQWKRNQAQMRLEDRKNSQAGDVVAEWNEWQAIIDKRRGSIYYFDRIARTSTWDRPKGFADFKLSPSQEAMMNEQRRRFDEWQSTNSEARVSVLGKGTIGTSSNKPKGKPASLPIVQQGEWGAYFDVKSDASEANVSLERAIGTTMSGEADDEEKARQWEESKRKERERKAKMRAERDAKTAETYNSAMSAELDRLEEAKKKETKKLPRPPRLPKEEPRVTSAETLVAPLKMETLYDVLGCDQAATRAELKRAYLSKAKLFHPDAVLQNGSSVDVEEAELKFVEVSEAWKILGDQVTRRRYDRDLQGKQISSKAGNLFVSFVEGAAKAMDEALSIAEDDVDGMMP